jgi:UDP-glucose 4-epimerase
MGARTDQSAASPASALVVGCGFIGGHLVRGLAAHGVEVTGLSRSFSVDAVECHVPGRLVQGDARDTALVRELARGVEEVVFSIGGLQPASAEVDPALDAAIMLEPLRAVIAALQGTPSRLTLISSGGAVYGNPNRVPADEDQPLCPIGAYGLVRALAERIVGSAQLRGDLRARIVRCANVYGEHQPLDRGQGAVGIFIDRIRRGEPIPVFGAGRTVRDFVYVTDVVEAISEMLGQPGGPSVVNVGSGVGTAIHDLIWLVEAAVGRRAMIANRPGRPFDVDEITLDITRLRRIVPFQPVPLREGIRRIASGATSRATATGVEAQARAAL